MNIPFSKEIDDTVAKEAVKAPTISAESNGWWWVKTTDSIDGPRWCACTITFTPNIWNSGVDAIQGHYISPAGSMSCFRMTADDINPSEWGGRITPPKE